MQNIKIDSITYSRINMETVLRRELVKAKENWKENRIPHINTTYTWSKVLILQACNMSENISLKT